MCTSFATAVVVFSCAFDDLAYSTKSGIDLGLVLMWSKKRNSSSQAPAPFAAPVLHMLGMLKALKSFVAKLSPAEYIACWFF